MIRFEDVSFTYTGAPRAALSGVSFALAPGELVVVVGANGSGKSTLARLCNGLLLPTSGRVLVGDGDTADERRIWDIRARVGYVQQNPDDQIVGTVVEEDVAFGPENLGVPADELRIRVDAALATAGLTGLERREPHLLSEGQKQRLSIAAALALRPAYLVLDEPTSMLDTQGRAMVLGVLDRLRGDGHGILHVTHHLVDAARADRVVALQAGALAYDGSPEGLLKDSEQMRSLNLERPPIATLADRARSLGAGIPAHAMDADSVVDALWA